MANIIMGSLILSFHLSLVLVILTFHILPNCSSFNLTSNSSLSLNDSDLDYNSDTELPTSTVDPHLPHSLPFLQKCSNADESLLLFDSLSVPLNLQYKYVPVGKLAAFQEQYYPAILYDFQLKALNNSDSGMCGGGGEDAEFSIEIHWAQNRTFLPKFYFTPNGFLIYSRLGREIYYDPHNFCIQSINETGLSVKACRSECSHRPEEKGRGVCIPKCCYFDRVMTDEGCKDVNEDWTVKTYLDLCSSSSFENVWPQFATSTWNSERWNCSGNRTEFIMTENEFRLVKSGQMFWKKLERFHWLKLYDFNDGSDERFRKFCVDAYWDEETDEKWPSSPLKIFSRSCDLDYLIELTQNLPKDPEQLELDYHNLLVIYPRFLFGILLVSSLIHISSLGIFILLWEEHNVHGWSTQIFLAGQFLLNAVLCMYYGAQSFGAHTALIQPQFKVLCVLFGASVHFLNISSFSLSTILTFDIWTKIRSMRPKPRTYKGRKRFLGYCSFGLGFPLVWVLAGALVEFESGCPEGQQDGMIRPGYSRECWITDGLPYLVYVTTPISILFLSNMALALSTVCYVVNAKKHVASMADSLASSANTRQNAKLVGKLFVMMGLLLILEVVQSYGNPILHSIYWVVLDFHRIFHAAALFWVFILNKRVLDQLATRYPQFASYLVSDRRKSSTAPTRSRSTTSTTPNTHPTRSMGPAKQALS